MPKVLVTLTNKQHEILKDMALFGTTNSERLRNVFVSFLVAYRLASKEEVKQLEEW